jgi:hydrogenase expression/formation protein HypC
VCLGIPGRVVELGSGDLAKVEVAGVRRTVNVGLVADEGLVAGDWVLIHVGFAMARIDEEEARRAFEGLELMGRAYEDELGALRMSRVWDAGGGAAGSVGPLSGGPGSERAEEAYGWGPSSAS